MAFKLLAVLALLVACGIVYAQEDECARLCQTDRHGLSRSKDVARGVKHRATRAKAHVAKASRQATDVEDYCATHCANSNRRKHTAGGASSRQSNLFNPLSIASSAAQVPGQMMSTVFGGGSGSGGYAIFDALSNLLPSSGGSGGSGSGGSSGSDGSASGGGFLGFNPLEFPGQVMSSFLGGGSDSGSGSGSGSGMSNILPFSNGGSGDSGSGGGLFSVPFQYVNAFLGSGGGSAQNPSAGGSSGGQSGSGQSSGSGTDDSGTSSGSGTGSSDDGAASDSGMGSSDDGAVSDRGTGSSGSGTGFPTNLNDFCRQVCGYIPGATGRKGQKQRHSRRSALPQPTAGQQTRQQGTSTGLNCDICDNLPNFGFGGTTQSGTSRRSIGGK